MPRVMVRLIFSLLFVTMPSAFASNRFRCFGLISSSLARIAARSRQFLIHGYCRAVVAGEDVHCLGKCREVACQNPGGIFLKYSTRMGTSSFRSLKGGRVMGNRFILW